MHKNNVPLISKQICNSHQQQLVLHFYMIYTRIFYLQNILQLLSILKYEVLYEDFLVFKLAIYCLYLI